MLVLTRSYIILVLTVNLVFCKIFSGITYSPYSLNGCLTSGQILTELQAVSQYTDHIRLYSGDCNQISLVLSAISKNNLALKVQLGIWTRDGKDRTHSDLNAVISAIKQYNHLITMVLVGNEDLFNGISENELIGNINLIKDRLKSNDIINIPVSTTEVHTLWTTKLGNTVDIIMPTVYPFYAPSSGDETMLACAKAAIDNIESILLKIGVSKPLIIGDTGYPSGGSAPNQFSKATQTNQCQYLAYFKCLADKKGYKYFFLEAKDGKWKQGYPSEQHLGILDANNQLKCSYQELNVSC